MDDIPNIVESSEELLTLRNCADIANALPVLVVEIKYCEEQLQANFSIERFMSLRYFSKIKALKMMLKYYVDHFESFPLFDLILFEIKSYMEVLRANQLSDFASQIKNFEVPNNDEVLCMRTADDSQMRDMIIYTIDQYLTEAEGDTFEIYRQSAEKHYEFIPHIIEQIQNFLDEVCNDSDGLFSNWRKINKEEYFIRGFIIYLGDESCDFEKEEKARVQRYTRKMANALTAEDWNETYQKIKDIEDKAISGISVEEDSSKVLSEEELYKIEELARHDELLKRLYRFSFDDELFSLEEAVYSFVNGICYYIDNGDIAYLIYEWIARTNTRKMNMYPELKAQYPKYLRMLKQMAGLENEEEEDMVECEEAVEVPKELQGGKKEEILKMFVDEGLLTQDYQPSSDLSRTQKAILADRIAELLEIKNKWKFFEGFWNMRALATAKTKGLDQKNMAEFMKKIQKIH